MTCSEPRHPKVRTGPIAVVGLLATIACGSSTSPNPNFPSPADPDISQLTMALDRDSLNLIVGDGATIVAHVRDAENQPRMDINVTWEAADSGVASISFTGRIGARAPGHTWIRARYGVLVDSASVTVKAFPGFVEITSVPATVAIDDTVRWSARLIGGQSGRVVHREIVWSVGDPNVASVSATGVLLGRTPGSTTVTARVAGLEASDRLNVMPPRFLEVSAGRAHTCAVTVTGLAYCWGSNEHGELGIGQATPSIPSPVLVSGGLRFHSVQAGSGYTCGVSREQQAYCWGDDSMLELGNPSVGKISTVPVPVSGGHAFAALGTSDMTHTCGITDRGVIWCWGYNRFGMVGNGSTRDEPVPIQVGENEQFSALSVGNSRTCGVTLTGSVVCWGRGGATLFANELVTYEYCGPTPCATNPVTAMTSESFRSVSTGKDHTCALTPDHRLLCWGRNESGQLGTETADSSRTPTPIARDVRFREVSVNAHHSCALALDGRVYCWGSNTEGRLGIGSGADVRVPTPVAGDGPMATVSAGLFHTCAVGADQWVYCWGRGATGALGNRVQGPMMTPSAISMLR